MPSKSAEPGKLYLVGTPIGNLGDITLRAIETLRAASIVFAEDTRRTRGLLAHLNVTGKRLESLDAHASDSKLAHAVARLLAGEDAALVTDAGMPGVSDPGARLVQAAAAAGVVVSVIPGPSAVSAAVALSGLVDGPFSFFGFLPRKGKGRQIALERIRDSAEPVVLFEAPGRIQATLDDLAALAPDRPATLCRELTKLHEQVLRGTLSELGRAPPSPRGEVVLVVGGGAPGESEGLSDEEVDDWIDRRLAEGASTKELSTELSQLTKRPRRELYGLIQSRRDQASR